MSQSAATIAVGLSGFSISPVGSLLRPADDVRARSASAIGAGQTWVVADSNGADNDLWLAHIAHDLATLLAVDADRSVELRRRVQRAASIKGRPLDGVLLREGARVSQERAWPAVAELVDEGALRCAGLVTGRPAVLQRCMTWRVVDAVLVPTSTPTEDRDALADICRWSGVTVLVPQDGDIHVRV